MDRKGAATAANARILRIADRDVKSAAERMRWLDAILMAPYDDLAGHLPTGRRPAKAAIVAVAAVIVARACGGEGLFFASLATAAKQIGGSASTVRVVLQLLERSGRLEGETRRKAGRCDADTTRYRLLPPTVAGGGTSVAGGGYPGDTPEGALVAGGKRGKERDTESALGRLTAIQHRALAYRDSLPWTEQVALALQHARSADGGNRAFSHPDVWVDAWKAAGCPTS